MKTNLREVAAASQIEFTPKFSGQNWGYVFALLGTVFFSMKSIFVKLIYQPVDGMEVNGVEAITIMVMRIGFSAPFYVAIFWWALRSRKTKGLPPLKKRDMALAAITGVLGYYICAWLDIEGMFVAYAGIGLIFMGGDIAVGINVPLGSAMILLCAALFAFFQLFAKPMISRLSSPVFTCCAMLGAGVMILGHFITENVILGDMSEVLNLPPRIWVLGIALAFFSTLLPSFMVNLAISKVGPQATSAVGMIAPISTIMLAIFVLGEPFGVLDGVGTLITVAGIGLYTHFDKKAISARPNSNLATDK